MGAFSKSSCLNPAISYIALNKCGPIGGLTNAATDVSSIPIPFTLIVIFSPLSHLVKSSHPYNVAPVPYNILSELNGSISRAATIQPSFGLVSGGIGFVIPKFNHGAAEISIV